MTTDTITVTPEAKHLCSRLFETVAGLRRDHVLTDAELIAAFLNVGTELAEATGGPGFAVGVLRGIADRLDREQKAMH